MHALLRSFRSQFLTLRNALSTTAMTSLTSLKFENKALKSLPVDESRSGNSRSRVPGACFSLSEPTPVENPQLVVHSNEALALIDVEEGDVENPDFLSYFSGNKIFNGSTPAAHCYCGHQFGYFSGQLGDGAAMYLGEVLNAKGERWELQLKGAGPTPYSRNSDGRKVLRSSIREFLCSEAMHHLGIPTTRAGACVTSDSRVVRDIYYDGNPIMERCTIVSRIAPTFLRFGSFEIFKPEDSQTGRAGPSVGRKDILEKMLEYAITTFYPDIGSKFEDDKLGCYLEFYTEVVRRTAKMVASWQCTGFCHGVLNTDNMSIMGVTIDYGPFGFMDYFDADYACNGSDNKGRYTYKKQPEICKWNLFKFAEAIQDVVPLDGTKKLLNEVYDLEFSTHYYAMMRKKIGISMKDDYNDEELIQKLLWTMQKTSCDFTNLFRILSDVEVSRDNTAEIVNLILSQCQDIDAVKKRVRAHANPQLDMLLKLADSHPGLLRQLNMDVEQLKEAKDQQERDMKLLNITTDERNKENETMWFDWLNMYHERLNMEVDDADGEEVLKKFDVDRKLSMDSVNPALVLRNHLAQEAIKLAEEGNFSGVKGLLEHLRHPYTYVATDECAASSSSPTTGCVSAPAWAAELKVT